MALVDDIPGETDSLNGRDRILLHAAQLFLDSGYAETSLRTIAEAVDMRPASIYHHFESKDALLAEILDIGMQAVTAAFDVTYEEARNASGPQRLAAHIEAHLDALFAHHAFTAAHVTVFPFVPTTVRDAAIGSRDAYEAQWSALLADIAPNLGENSLRLTRLALFGAMNSTVQWFDPSRASLNELSSSMAQTFWTGFRGD